MAFWEAIFLDSMNSFENDHLKKPKDQPEPAYSIRGLKSWVNVYSQLQKARECYDGTKKGFWGRVKRGIRNVGDNFDPVQQVVNAIPDNEYVSPVLAIVQILLDVS